MQPSSEVEPTEVADDDGEMEEIPVEDDDGVAGDNDDDDVIRSPSLASSLMSVEEGWLRCNLDTGASVTVFPKKMFDTFGEDPRLTMKTASGEIVRAYGNTALHGEDTEGVMRKLNGNVADVHKILVSAARMHERGYATWLGPGGGEIIPINRPINKAMNEAYHAAVQRHGKDGIIPVVEEDGVYNFYLKEKIPAEGEEAARSPDQPPPPSDSSWGPII